MNESEKKKLALEAEWEGILVRWKDGEAKHILEFIDVLEKEGWPRRDAVQYVAHISQGK